MNSPNWLHTKNPLIIASSGGGGHIIAAESLIQQLEEKNATLIPKHHIKPASIRKYSMTHLLHCACELFHHPKLHTLCTLLSPLKLPSPKELQAEIKHLMQKNNESPKKYIDFMLDIQPNGYAFAGLFNYLQKKGHPYSLNKMTEQQYWLDKIYKKKIEQQFEHLLLTALQQKKPYDSILVTQPIGLAAIFRAISKYNLKRSLLAKQYDCDVPSLKIHLFITDIPYATAKHYLKPLQHLDFLEKRELIIHMLDVGEHHHILEKKHAAKVFRYAPQHFPIIRSPFKTLTPDTLKIDIPVLRIAHDIIPISSQEHIACIMLSSSQGDLTINYLNHLLKLNLSHIIIIGPLPPKLRNKIQSLQKKHSHTKIYTPGFVDANTLSHILKLSHFIILKGGGLSLMEIAAMTLSKKTLIFVHQNDECQASGLPWELGNTQWFMQYNQEHRQPTATGQPDALKKHYPMKTFR